MKTSLLLLLSTLTSLASGDLLVSWSPSPTPGIDGYYVYWQTLSNSPLPWIRIATVGPTVTSAPASTNTVGHNFYYVTAFASTNESDPSLIAFRPYGPTNAKPSGSGLTWTACPSTEQVTNYTAYWTTNPAQPKPWSVYGTTSGTSLGGNTSGYYFYLTSANPYGVSDPTPVVFKPGPPPGPVKIQ